MNAVFCMFTHFTYEHMILYMNHTSIVTKGQKRVQKRGKNGVKKVKIQKYTWRRHFLHNFSYNMHNTYRLHFVSFKDVSKGHWRSKSCQKKVKKEPKRA